MKKSSLLHIILYLLFYSGSTKVVSAQYNSNTGTKGRATMNKPVFESTSLYSAKLITVPGNTEFDILEERKEGSFRWYKLTHQGKTGWITDTGTSVLKKSGNQTHTTQKKTQQQTNDANIIAVDSTADFVNDTPDKTVSSSPKKPPLQKKPVKKNTRVVYDDTAIDTVATVTIDPATMTVSKVGQTGIVTQNKVVYKRPSISSEPLAVLKKNAGFRIEQVHREGYIDWYRLIADGENGWITAENTKLNTTEPKPDNTPANQPTNISKPPTYTMKKASRHYDWISKFSKKNVGGIEASYEYPLFNDEQLNSALRKRFTDKSSFEKAADAYIAEQKQTYADFKDDDFGASGLGQGYTLKIKVMRQIPDFTLFKAEWIEDNEGAAHPQWGEIYLIYDSRAQRMLKLDDILIGGGRSQLRRIAEQTFRRNEKLSANASLCNGYLFDKCRFELADNFTATSTTLDFIYNPYEGKSFAEGIWSVKVPYKSISQLINPEYEKLFH